MRHANETFDVLTRVRLRNFKSFVDQTIDLGPFTILIGANGAGKSNLFDALRFLRSIGEGRSVRDAIEGHAPPGVVSPLVSGIRGGGIAATHFSNDDNSFSLEVTVQVDLEEIRYFVEIDARRHRVVSEELISNAHPGQYVYSTRPETGPLEQSEESPVISARFHKNARGINPKREFSPAEFILSQFTSRRAESRINEEVADTLRQELSSISPLELQPDVLRKYSPMGRFQMGEHGEYFAAAVWKLNNDALTEVDYEIDEDTDTFVNIYDEASVERRDSVLAWLSQVTPRRITSLDTATSPTNEVIVCVKEEPYEHEITAPSLSDGTLRFAALALATVGSGGRRSLLIEELENGINPSRIALLVQMIEQTVAADTDVQVITSTHSPAVLDFAKNDTVSSAVVIGWDDEGMSSRAVTLAELPGLSDALRSQTIGDLQEEGWLQLAAGI